MKLLMSADLHLGKRSSRIGQRSTHTTIACWRRMVSLAIEREVDAVLLAGDVVDQRNRRFESFGPLDTGVQQLAKEGITTVAVSGNHDFDVLPQLIDSIEEGRFYLLGRGGVWESQVFEFDGETLRVDGWCFPEQRVVRNPVEDYSLDSASVDVHIGMLHGDLDAVNSIYAPVSMASLTRVDVDGWLLGHIHKPELRNAQRPWILYPGSPQAMDPGEEEVHGVWLLDTKQSRQPEMIPLSSVCYKQLFIDVTSCPDDEDIYGHITHELKTEAARLVDKCSSQLEIVSLRPTIAGECESPHQVIEGLEDLDSYEQEVNGVMVMVDKYRHDLSSQIDKEEFVGQKNALARAVHLLDEFETGNYSDMAKKLMSRYQASSRRLNNNYGLLDDDESEFDEEALVFRLKRQLKLLIAAAVEQS